MITENKTYEPPGSFFLSIQDGQLKSGAAAPVTVNMYMKITEIDYRPQEIPVATPKDNPALLNLNTYIKQHCSQWLEETNKIVYRGVRTQKPYFMQYVRKDRYPKDTGTETHGKFNNAIKNAGRKANRENSIFVTGFTDYAGAHGNLYAIFPMGPFNYTWHPEHPDWTTSYDDGELQIMGDLPNPNLLLPKGIKTFENMIKGDDGTLNSAIASGHEIMIKCDKAIYISYLLSQDLKINI